MNVRFTTSRIALAVVVATAAMTSTLRAQAPAGAAGTGYSVPRTPHGHPDLQGNWSSATLTPLERPAGQGPVLSWEDVARMEGRAEASLEAGLRPSDPNRPAPRAGGSVGGYNRVYFDRGDRVAIVNGEPRSSLVVDPPNGRVPPLTAGARRRRAEDAAARSRFGQFDHPELRPLGERCLMSFGSSAGPPMIPNAFYNNNYTIVQTPDHVLILAEMVHDARIIRLGDGPRLPADLRPWMGDSWGWWEGDTLVVETTNINPNQRFRGNPSENMKVTERFHRVDDEALLYRFTVEDPTTYAAPWSAEIPLNALDGLLYEYACHEGNYALYGILSGARYRERMGLEDAADPTLDQGEVRDEP